MLIEACRGKHVDFAAPGADMAAAGLNAEFALVRGTSFAAPIAAGLFARQLIEIDRARADSVVAALTSQAVDLGVRGPDKVYGNGLLGDDAAPVASTSLIGRRFSPTPLITSNISAWTAREEIAPPARIPLKGRRQAAVVMEE